MTNGDRMDRFEQGLERLRERHEALAQSVEMLTRDVHEMAKTPRAAQAANEERLAKLMDVYTRLGNIVISH